MEHASRKRKVYLSRKTSFPIFSQDPADAWLQLLNLVLRIGSEKPGRGGDPVAEALNAMVTVGLPVIAEDLEVEVAEPEAFPAWLGFDREGFERHYQAWPGARRLDAACDALRGRADGPAEPLLELSAQTLCASFDPVDGALFASFVIRHIDVFAEWPLEAMALRRLHAEAAERLGLEAGATTFVVQSAQLAAGDWDRAEALLAEHFRRPLPLQVDHSGVFLFGNDGGKARAMLLDHDAATIFWEEAFDTTEELSWYIVDTMPWLLPQHVRYVGQECSTLKRAIREGACYEQG
jgi:hypothetical protein